MIDLVLINILKLLNKLLPSIILRNKIKHFNLNRAYQTINKLQKVKKKIFLLKK